MLYLLSVVVISIFAKQLAVRRTKDYFHSNISDIVKHVFDNISCVSFSAEGMQNMFSLGLKAKYVKKNFPFPPRTAI